MKAALISLAFLTVLISPRLAMACSCGRTPAVCESLAAAEAVFVGTVTRVENKTVKAPEGQEAIAGQTAYVQVEESFKGAKESAMIFRSYGSSCDARYEEGQRWLFYAYFNKDDKAWQIHGCDRSTLLEGVADDLLYLRNLPASAHEGRFSFPVLEGFKGALRSYKYTYSGEAEKCPQLLKFVKGQGMRSVEVQTNVIKLEMNTDYKDLELKFPFPACPKPKDRQ